MGQKAVIRSLFMGFVLCAGAWLIALTPASGQALLAAQQGTEAEAATLPETLTPDQVDGLLSRMTDTDIRALLREELVRRAEEEQTEDAGFAMTLEQIEARLTEMSQRIDERVNRWINDLINIDNRKEKVAERLAKAERGIGGMLLGAAIIVALGFGLAMTVIYMTRPWRTWLCNPKTESYWDRVVRTIAMGAVELLPIVAFVVITRMSMPLISGLLGPLADYGWIYYTGVSYSWAFVVFTRRAFAPDAPKIRIAPLTDELAERLHFLLRFAVQIGAAGWLVGGLFFHLGYGFPPAMVLRALAGTVVALVLLFGLWSNRERIRDATALVFEGEARHSALGRIVVAAAPWLLGFYIIAAWVYWLAHWLETGTDRLAGPVGSLVVYLALPIVDRMGREIIRSLIPPNSDLRQRMVDVFCGAWRLAIGLAAGLLIAWLWGINVLALAKGPEASAWASTGFDIVVTTLLGYLIWRLVAAALHTERKVSSAAEDVDPSSVPAASRLNTLIPLFRNFLLGFLAIVVMMIVLSAVGVDIGPLIASAGIIGIAIGFGAQSLVRDVFSGIFFLIDDAFRVGEYIELDADMRGEVEAISIRSLQLRHHRGPVITIPFGELKSITNHNRDWVIYKMSFRMEPETDPQKFKKLVKNVGKEFLAHPDHGPKFIEPLKSQGVYYVDDDSALVMRVKFKCKPRAQFVLRREIYHRLRTVFAENDMFLARRKVEVVGPDGEPVSEKSGAVGEIAETAQSAGIGGVA